MNHLLASLEFSITEWPSEDRVNLYSELLMRHEILLVADFRYIFIYEQGRSETKISIVDVSREQELRLERD